MQSTRTAWHAGGAAAAAVAESMVAMIDNAIEGTVAISFEFKLQGGRG